MFFYQTLIFLPAITVKRQRKTKRLLENEKTKTDTHNSYLFFIDCHQHHC